LDPSFATSSRQAVLIPSPVDSSLPRLRQAELAYVLSFHSPPRLGLGLVSTLHTRLTCSLVWETA
jgi:hypothetical protein